MASCVTYNILKYKLLNVIAGDVHADFTGHSPASGPGRGISMTVHRGAAGGGHGGRGGRSYGGYHSALAHGSLYTPHDKGSGGGSGATSAHQGGRGGGTYLGHTGQIK